MKLLSDNPVSELSCEVKPPEIPSFSPAPVAQSSSFFGEKVHANTEPVHDKEHQKTLEVRAFWNASSLDEAIIAQNAIREAAPEPLRDELNANDKASSDALWKAYECSNMEIYNFE